MHVASFKNSLEYFGLVEQLLPNPDIVLQRRGQGISYYSSLLTDAHLTACLDSREAVTLSQSWQLERNDCPKRLFDGIEEWFFTTLNERPSTTDLDFNETADNILDVIFWGFQPIELIWNYGSRLWTPRMVPKPPHWFTFYVRSDGTTELRFLDINHPVDGIPAPDEFTFICPRIKPSFDNPYGRGSAQKCFWPITFKKGGIEFWMNFIERFGIPWVKGTSKLPITDPDELSQFKTDLSNLVQQAVICLTGERDVALIESSNRSQGSQHFKLLCDYMDSQISKAILGHTMATDLASGGASYGAQKGAMTIRADLAQNDTKILEGIFNHAIGAIMKRNGYKGARPVARPVRKEVVDLTRAQRDEALTRSGIEFKEQYWMRAYDLKEGDFKVVPVNPKPLEVKKDQDNDAPLDGKKKQPAQ